MHTIQIEEGESQDIEVWVAGHRVITLSLNKHSMAVQIPGGVDPHSIVNTSGSFYARTKEIYR